MTSISSTGSPSGSSSASGVPGGEPVVEDDDPVVPPRPISSSAAERIIPSEGTPRSFALRIFIPPGIVAPGRTTATVWPASTLGAPQTIVRSPSPVSTLQTLSRSALGCCSRSSTLPTTKPSLEGGPIVSSRSTSVPVITSRSASAAGSHAGVAVLAQPGVRDPHENCSSIRTSLSKKRRRSGMPWRSIATRSTPIPKAKPWTRSAS